MTAAAKAAARARRAAVPPQRRPLSATSFGWRHRGARRGPGNVSEAVQSLDLQTPRPASAHGHEANAHRGRETGAVAQAWERATDPSWTDKERHRRSGFGRSTDRPKQTECTAFRALQRPIPRSIGAGGGGVRSAATCAGPGKVRRRQQHRVGVPRQRTHVRTAPVVRYVVRYNLSGSCCTARARALRPQGGNYCRSNPGAPSQHVSFGGGGGSDLGTLAKPSYQIALDRALGIRNQRSPVVRLSHSAVWYRA